MGNDSAHSNNSSNTSLASISFDARIRLWRLTRRRIAAATAATAAATLFAANNPNKEDNDEGVLVQRSKETNEASDEYEESRES